MQLLILDYIPHEIYIGIVACTTSKHCLSQKRRENPYGWCVNPTNFQMYISYGILNKNPVCSVDREVMCPVANR